MRALQRLERWRLPAARPRLVAVNHLVEVISRDIAPVLIRARLAVRSATPPARGRLVADHGATQEGGTTARARTRVAGCKALHACTCGQPMTPAAANTASGAAISAAAGRMNVGRP